jgi:nucleoid-associated protein YgaU
MSGVKLPSGDVLSAAIALMTSLGRDEGKGRDLLLSLQAVTAKNEKLLADANLKFAQAGNLAQREKDVAAREEIAERAIAEQQRMRAAFYAASESLET